jgi:glycosyltransferase involved in cell wall biosynthesis
MTPRVSVLLPVRDGERFVGEAIESILAQTERNFELIVVDDGSTDATPEIVRGFDDPRIRILRQEAAGLVAALNRGVEACTAPYIARQDADDSSLPVRLDRQAAFLDTHPDVAVVASWAARVDADGVQRDVLAVPTQPQALRRALLVGNPFVHGSVVVRAEALAEVGGYRADYPHNEDYDLWRRIARRHGVAVVPEPLYVYREHASGVSRARAAEQGEHRRRIIDEEWSVARAPAAFEVLRGGWATGSAGERSAYVDLQLALARALVARGRRVRGALVAAEALALAPRRILR